VDPVAFAGDTSYAYAANRPIAAVDPGGLSWRDLVPHWSCDARWEYERRLISREPSTQGSCPVRVGPNEDSTNQVPCQADVDGRSVPGRLVWTAWWATFEIHRYRDCKLMPCGFIAKQERESLATVTHRAFIGPVCWPHPCVDALEAVRSGEDLEVLCYACCVVFFPEGQADTPKDTVVREAKRNDCIRECMEGHLPERLWPPEAAI